MRWSVDVALVRDPTDTMYNPAMAPYVSHDEGTALVIGYGGTLARLYAATGEHRSGEAMD